MNDLFRQLNQQSNPNLGLSQSVQQNNLFKDFLNSSNSSEFLKSIISKNPQLQNVVNLMQTSGMSPKQFFYNYAAQKGIDPDQFLNNLMNN